MNWWMVPGSLLVTGIFFCAIAQADETDRRTVADSSQPVTIVILGSSTASGKNLDKPMYGGREGDLKLAWPNRYAEFLEETRPGSKVINLSKPGRVTYHAMPTGTKNPEGIPDPDPSMNVTAALKHGPDAIILAYPGIGEDSDLLEVISNVDAIQTAAGDVPVWVQTPQPAASMSPETLAARLKFREMLIEKYGDRVLDFWTPLALSDNSAWDSRLGLTDGGHPNKDGHFAIFEVVREARIPESALRR